MRHTRSIPLEFTFRCLQGKQLLSIQVKSAFWHQPSLFIHSFGPLRWEVLNWSTGLADKSFEILTVTYVQMVHSGYQWIQTAWQKMRYSQISSPNSSTCLWQDMATTFEIQSNASVLESNLRLQRSVERLEFVTISNPNELGDKKNRKTIRRHVGHITSKHGFKRRIPVSRVFDLPVPDSLSRSSASVDPEIANSDLNSDIVPRIQGTFQSIQPLEHGVFSIVPRPLGIGPGLNPLLNFPIEFNTRNSRLFDFCMHSLIRNSYLC